MVRIESFLLGHGIHVSSANLQAPGELENELRRLKPSDIILIEPFLDAMRVIELHEAERQQNKPDGVELEDLRLHLLNFKNSAEKFMHMTYLEEEKRGFKALIDMKPHL